MSTSQDRTPQDPATSSPYRSQPGDWTFGLCWMAAWFTALPTAAIMAMVIP